MAKPQTLSIHPSSTTYLGLGRGESLYVGYNFNLSHICDYQTYNGFVSIYYAYVLCSIFFFDEKWAYMIVVSVQAVTRITAITPL